MLWKFRSQTTKLSFPSYISCDLIHGPSYSRNIVASSTYYLDQILRHNRGTDIYNSLGYACSIDDYVKLTYETVIILLIRWTSTRYPYDLTIYSSDAWMPIISYLRSYLLSLSLTSKYSQMRAITVSTEEWCARLLSVTLLNMSGLVRIASYYYIILIIASLQFPYRNRIDQSIWLWDN